MYSVQMVGMGYDFNGVDFILFSDPKMSNQDILWCIGRGLRYKKGKTLWVVICVCESQDSKMFTKKRFVDVYNFIQGQIKVLDF